MLSEEESYPFSGEQDQLGARHEIRSDIVESVRAIERRTGSTVSLHTLLILRDKEGRIGNEGDHLRSRKDG